MALNEQHPLAIDYNSLGTSSIKFKEFQASDVVPISDGGTGVSSLTSLSSLLGVDSLSSGLSGVSSTVFDNSGAWAAGGVSDHSGLNLLDANDHPQYVLSSTNSALSSLVTTNQTNSEGVSSTVFDNSAGWAGGGVSVHDQLTGLGDDDHPQYVLSATNSALSSLVTTNQTNSEGVSSTVFDNSSTWAVDTDTTDHGAFTGLGDNDHPQYVLSSTNNALSSLVTTNQTNLEGVSSTVFDNSSTWAVDTDTTDHGALTGLGDNDHPQYVLSSTNNALSSLVTTNQTNSEGVSSTVFDNSSIWSVDTDTTDHGAFTGLTDNDHPQYVLSSTNASLSSLVTTNQTNSEGVSSTVFDNSSTWAVDTDTTDHGAFTGLGDNDHPQYVLSATNATLSSLVTTNQTNSEGVSSTVFDNSSTWAVDTDTTDHTALSNIGIKTHTQLDNLYDTVNTTSGAWSVDTDTTDHGAFTGLSDNDHPQYVLSSTNNALSSLVATNQTNSEGVSSTVFDNSATWATDTDTTDHTALSNIGTRTHPELDNLYTTVNTASGSWAVDTDTTDHGSFTGLTDDDHTQYVLADGTRAVTGNLNVSGSLKSAKSVSLATEYSNGTSGTAINIDWNNGNYQTVTMNATTTFTFTAPSYGVASLILRIVQSGSSNVTTLPTILWPRGSSPSVSTVSGAVDLITLYYNGTSYYGNFGGAFA